MPSVEAVTAELLALERDLTSADTRKSDRVAHLLADGFVEFGSSGRVYTKAQVIRALREEEPCGGELAEFRARPLAADVFLVTYLFHGSDAPMEYSLRSSIWRKEADGWKLVFHQGTPTQKGE